MARRARTNKKLMTFGKRYKVSLTFVGVILIAGVVLGLSQYFGWDLKSMVFSAPVRHGEIMLIDKTDTTKHGTWTTVNGGAMMSLDNQSGRVGFSGSNLVLNGVILTPITGGGSSLRPILFVNPHNVVVYAIPIDNKTVVFIDSVGTVAAGTFTSTTQVTVPFWNNDVATFSGNLVNWSDGTIWVVPTAATAKNLQPATAPLLADYNDPSGGVLHFILNTTGSSLPPTLSQATILPPTPAPTAAPPAATPVPTPRPGHNLSCNAQSFTGSVSPKWVGDSFVPLNGGSYTAAAATATRQALQTAQNTCGEYLSYLESLPPPVLQPNGGLFNSGSPCTAQGCSIVSGSPGSFAADGGISCSPSSTYYNVQCKSDGSCGIWGQTGTPNTPSVQCVAWGHCYNTTYTCF